ncbi:MAG: hypothetical protein ACLTCQ_23660 [Enterocloster bolteae]
MENGLLDLSNLADSTVDSGKIGGKLYGICNGLNAPMMIYNKTITDNAGIEIGDEITLDHYIEYSKLIYEKRVPLLILHMVQVQNIYSII